MQMMAGPKFVYAKIGAWRPHRDLNADLKLRRLLFYPVKLWGHGAIITS